MVLWERRKPRSSAHGLDMEFGFGEFRGPYVGFTDSE